jgi:hypothetical protein
MDKLLAPRYTGLRSNARTPAPGVAPGNRGSVGVLFRPTLGTPRCPGLCSSAGGRGGARRNASCRRQRRFKGTDPGHRVRERHAQLCALAHSRDRVSEIARCPRPHWRLTRILLWRWIKNSIIPTPPGACGMPTDCSTSLGASCAPHAPAERSSTCGSRWGCGPWLTGSSAAWQMHRIVGPRCGHQDLLGLVDGLLGRWDWTAANPEGP